MDTTRLAEPSTGTPQPEVGGAQPPIYESGKGGASKQRPDGILQRAAVGTVAGAAVWFTLSEMGVPQLGGYGKYHLYPVLIPLGLLLGFTRFRRPLVWLATALTIFLGVLAFSPLMRQIVLGVVRSDPVPASADAIVILSAGVNADGGLNAQSLDRLLSGLALAKSGVAPRTVLTSERLWIGGRVVSSEDDQNRVVALSGVSDVIRTDIVASTRQEALQVAELAKRGGWQRIVLVTSPMHTRRACATFEKVGLVVSCVPSESRELALSTFISPDVRVKGFALWLYEQTGMLRYRVSGWV